MTESEMRARALALSSHGGQLYGDMPYSVHLAATVAVLVRFGFDRDVESTLYAAAWLHDAVEDTNLAIAEVAFETGPEVATLVHLVTDEQGRTRDHRKRKPLPKIASAPEAVVVKLADRIANVENSLRMRPDLLTRYAAEQCAFRTALVDANVDPRVRRMWSHLEGLLSGAGD